MNIQKNFQGALVISDIVDNQSVTKTYMGYTKKEAVAKFKEFVKELETGENR